MKQRVFSLFDIWNLSFGFFGIQFGWGLQMANMSAIYQYLGADESDIPLLWLAAPVTGLLVQPVVGYYSDRTWTRLGRRRPYFLGGAILASLALIAMPNSSTLWMAAGLLWVLDASVNISMEPFRAFVGDLLPPVQRKVGFAMQSLLIGLGAVLSSSLPWVLTNLFGMASDAGAGRIPASVHIAFYVGSAVFISAVLYTILTTPENPPADMQAFQKNKVETSGAMHAVTEIFGGIAGMPKVMRQLAVVQFFTWLGLFCMWIYFTPSIARQVFGGTPGTAEYQEGVEWGGLCFGVYNFTAFAFSFLLVRLVRSYSAKSLHRVFLGFAGLGLLAVGWWGSHWGLLISMIGVGIGWASILSMPYAMLSNAIPAEKMGFYMGVFNFFIVLPQILAATLLGKVVEHFLDGRGMPVVMFGGVSMLLAAGALAFVKTDPSSAAAGASEPQQA